jgi:hypothetical protein
VDDAAEDVMTADRAGMRRSRTRLGHGEVQASMGTGLVVMADVSAEDRLELTA